VIQGLLPTLGLRIFLAIVPIILKVAAIFISGHLSKSAIDFEVGRKYYFFQFVVVFLFTTVIATLSSSSGGSSANSNFPIIDLIKSIQEDPAVLTTVLGEAIPNSVGLSPTMAPNPAWQAGMATRWLKSKSSAASACRAMLPSQAGAVVVAAGTSRR
jgi:hypothetical protein